MSEAARLVLMQMGVDMVKLICVGYVAYQFSRLLKVVVKQAVKEAIRECADDARH